MNGEMPAGLIFVCADEKSYCERVRRTSRVHHKNENQQTAQIFRLRPLAFFCAEVSSELSPNQAQG